MVDKFELPKWLLRGIEESFPIRNFDQTLASKIDEANKNKRKLRVKLGIDPTGTDIHLGHSILFRKLRAFQDNGHVAVLIIGDFTAQIGDPTGKNKTRIQLSEEEVKENSKTYCVKDSHFLSQVRLFLIPMRCLLMLVSNTIPASCL